MRSPCRFWPDHYTFLIHYGNFTIWLCHRNQNFVVIGRNSAISVPFCLICHGGSSAFRALAKLNYFGRIRDCKFKTLPNVCAMTAARTHVIFHIPIDKYSLIADKQNCQKFTFSYFADSLGLGGLRKFERLLVVSGHWTVTARPKYVIFHTVKGITIWLHSHIKKFKKITPCGFYSLLKKVYKFLSPGVHNLLTVWCHDVIFIENTALYYHKFAWYLNK